MRAVCGRAPARASELVAAGRGLAALPATAKALDAGQVSFDNALTIARVAGQLTPGIHCAGAAQPTAVPGDAAGGDGTAGDDAGGDGADGDVGHAEQILLDAAAGGVTCAQLRQLGEEITYRADPQAADERERRRWERRHLSFGLTLDNTGTLTGACGDTLSYETVRTAAEAFAPPGGALDTRTAAQRRLDGLVAACRTALDTAAAPTRHGAAPHIVVLVHDHTLAQAAQSTAPPGVGSAMGPPTDATSAGSPVARGAPPARTGHGAMLTARQVLALCCSARVTAIRWADGLPLDVGRTTRTEPPALRNALNARDRTCRWPGCDIPAQWCTAHHVGGWANGATTSLNDMILLCHAHHTHFIHLLDWTITGSPNATVHFRHPGGLLTLESPLPGKRDVLGDSQAPGDARGPSGTWTRGGSQAPDKPPWLGETPAPEEHGASGEAWALDQPPVPDQPPTLDKPRASDEPRAP